MKQLLKRLASRLPLPWQQQLKRLHFAREIAGGRFITTEPEFPRLAEWVQDGDWVLDVGANIGHYTLRLSRLVGAKGRVLSFEPVPETLELLAANVASAKARNVTLLNTAASDRCCTAGIQLPQFESGLDNYYMAHLTEEAGAYDVLCLRIDSLGLSKKIAFAKIDAEGHELQVLKGMTELLKRDHPVLVVEENSPEIHPYLAALGYESERMAGSSNNIYRAG